ncbi:MAG: ABC transporter ATP-binding protein [Brevinematales bacterium]|nr:ABC transporter ATP-binding protein [Brevinematales bacterium]
MIEVKDVIKHYRIGKTIVEALRGVSLTIHQGEMVALAGVSGSGKSTLLHLIGGMDRPTHGEIWVDGEKITAYTPRELTRYRGKKIGFVFQNFHLIPALNVYENVVVPLKLKGERYERKDILALLERVGLHHHLLHRPDELSGGQKQRVAIARALASRPSYVLADEPTANLDRKTGMEILALLQELNKELGTTIILASHDQGVLSSFGRVMYLQDGLLV